MDASLPGAPPASVAARVAAALGGVVILLLGAVVSMGAVLLAPAGAWLARRVLRRGGGLGGRWIASTVTVALVLAAVSALAFSALPPGALSRAQAVQDSIARSRPQPPPPAWMERVAPGSTRAAGKSLHVPPRFKTAFTIWAGAMGAVVVAAFYGTLGWAGGLLLSFARHGRWPTARPAVVSAIG